MFFFGSLQLLFMGVIGEYIGNIHTQVHKRPLVVESERLNFQYEPGEPLSPSLRASAASAGG
jgi:polyisoprenyl-phosphate glycosyltransferase